MPASPPTLCQDAGEGVAVGVEAAEANLGSAERVPSPTSNLRRIALRVSNGDFHVAPPQLRVPPWEVEDI